MTIIYKILPEQAWRDAEAHGLFNGASIDLTDGFIHFSTAAQTQETADKHFTGQAGLVLVSINAEAFGADLKWEVSRGGDLFPHLYAPLPTAAVISVDPIPLDASGRHDFRGLLS